MSVCVYYSFDRLFPNIEGVTHRNENCNVCMCILLPWSHISPTWRGLLTEMRIAMSVCVYYSLDHLLSRHGGGCSQKWELQCLNGYIIPLITYFPDMERVAHRNENCNVCICIFFLWSPFSPTWRELLIEMRDAMSENVYYLFLWSPFPQHGGGCSQKWELQCLHVYIIPLITYFHNMEGVSHRNENCNVCTCILFPWSPISTTWKGFLTEMRIAMSVCIYSSLDHAFPKHGVGCWEKWELQCLYVYIIPFDRLFPNIEGVTHRSENCNVCMLYIIPLIAYFQT